MNLHYSRPSWSNLKTETNYLQDRKVILKHVFLTYSMYSRMVFWLAELSTEEYPRNKLLQSSPGHRAWKYFSRLCISKYPHLLFAFGYSLEECQPRVAGRCMGNDWGFICCGAAMDWWDKWWTVTPASIQWKKHVMNSNHFGLAYWLPLRGLLGTRKVATNALIRSVRGMSVKQTAATQSGGWIAGVNMQFQNRPTFFLGHVWFLLILHKLFVCLFVQELSTIFPCNVLRPGSMTERMEKRSVTCAWTLSCRFMGMSKVVCPFVGAPHNFNTSWLLHLKIFLIDNRF